jgi:hypothetical protein
MGGWVDGLITVRKFVNELRMLVEEFHLGGGDQKPCRTDPELHRMWFEEIYIYNVSRNELGFIDFMTRNVLPVFR